MNAVLRGPERLAAVSIGIVAIAATFESVLFFDRVADMGRASWWVAYRLAVTGNGLLDVVGVSIGIASLGALTGWLAWQYRASSLLMARGTPTPHTPQWAVFWWFVPVADLWMPGVTNAELWKGARATAGKGGGSWPVWVWWSVFIVGWVAHAAGHVVRQAVLGIGSWGVEGPSRFPAADVVNTVRVGSVIAGVGATMLVAAAPLAVFVLRRITSRLSEAGPIVAPARPDA